MSATKVCPECLKSSLDCTCYGHVLEPKQAMERRLKVWGVDSAPALIEIAISRGWIRKPDPKRGNWARH